ncbi:hypothetical protein TNCV_769511 [Trichonephila clavipes]|nr:hypothetical protein TNCV_769511 [Trichonephila clavipes]
MDPDDIGKNNQKIPPPLEHRRYPHDRAGWELSVKQVIYEILRVKLHSHQGCQRRTLSVQPIRDFISPEMKSLIGSMLKARR